MGSSRSQCNFHHVQNEVQVHWYKCVICPDQILVRFISVQNDVQGFRQIHGELVHGALVNKIVKDVSSDIPKPMMNGVRYDREWITLDMLCTYSLSLKHLLFITAKRHDAGLGGLLI